MWCQAPRRSPERGWPPPGRQTPSPAAPASTAPAHGVDADARDDELVAVPRPRRRARPPRRGLGAAARQASSSVPPGPVTAPTTISPRHRRRRRARWRSDSCRPPQRARPGHCWHAWQADRRRITGARPTSRSTHRSAGCPQMCVQRRRRRERALGPGPGQAPPPGRARYQSSRGSRRRSIPSPRAVGRPPAFSGDPRAGEVGPACSPRVH